LFQGSSLWRGSPGGALRRQVRVFVLRFCSKGSLLGAILLILVLGIFGLHLFGAQSFATQRPGQHERGRYQERFDESDLRKFIHELDIRENTSLRIKPCFDAASWAASFKAERGWRFFSQGFQDSVLASLFAHLGTRTKEYVEFGFHVSDMQGTSRHVDVRGRHPVLEELPPYGGNTVLLQHRGWTGVRFDGDEENRTLVPNLHRAFITPQNVVDVFWQHNVSTNVDYVSIDIDSCDLWTFLALTDVYRPAVVTVEYNANYFFNESLTSMCSDPRRGFFSSTKFTGRHWGWSASLAAFHKAAVRRGYTIVWVEPLLDVFLVRSDKICQPGGVPPLEQFKFATGLRQHAGRIPAVGGMKLFKEWIGEYH